MNENKYKIPNINNISPGAEASVHVPGSKSITNRALLLAALSDGENRILNAQKSEDASVFLEALKTLGFVVSTENNSDNLNINIIITGEKGQIPNKKTGIYVGSAGTAARFLCAMLSFSDGEYLINASEQMCRRPMKPLIDSLRSAGAKITCIDKEGYLPIRLTGALHPDNTGSIPDKIDIDIDKSSQFLSALLIAAGTLQRDITINAHGTHGMDYVYMTIAMMRDFGIETETVDDKDSNNSIKTSFVVKGKENNYKNSEYSVEPDMSAAAYFYAMAALTGASIKVYGIKKPCLQGDIKILDVLKKMGAEVDESDPDSITVSRDPHIVLKGGFSVDMASFSDQALTIAAISPYANAPVRITGIGHIRGQECDRINAITENMKKLGIVTEETEDTVTIYPGSIRPAEIETYDDHRVAMAFSLTGLLSEGITIKNPGCCKKTFAEYFEVFEDAIRQLQE